MNELLFWCLVGISSLQVTNSFSQQKPLHTFDYEILKKYSVFPIGIPNSEKTRNKNQVFILGEGNPVFMKDKENTLTFAAPVTLVLSATNTKIMLEDIEQKIKDRYGMQIKFSENSTIVVCDPRSNKQSLYCKLQDEQLRIREFERCQEQRRIRACRALSTL